MPVVLRHCPRPDRYDRQMMRLPSGLELTASDWTREVFDVRRTSLVIRALLALRQVLVPLIGVPPTRGNPFRVREVVDDEALIAHREPHLDFWCGVLAERDTLEVTTAVTLHGWRGRLYFVPVGLLHAPVTRAMMRSAVRRVAAAHGPSHYDAHAPVGRSDPDTAPTLHPHPHDTETEPS